MVVTGSELVSPVPRVIVLPTTLKDKSSWTTDRLPSVINLRCPWYVFKNSHGHARIRLWTRLSVFLKSEPLNPISRLSSLYIKSIILCILCKQLHWLPNDSLRLVSEPL